MSGVSSNRANDISVVWSKERCTIQELISNEYGTFSESKSLLVRVHCMKKGCRCVLKNEQALTLKCVSQVTLVHGIWTKGSSKLSYQGTNKAINVILTSSNITWFEILNESGQTAPSWTSTKFLIKNKPSSFLVRKDLKCLLPRRTSSETFLLNMSHTITVIAGTVLNYIQSKEFFVQKGKKSKEMVLIQCCDNNLSNVFICPDEKCSISPLAGISSITGVHNLYSIIQQFQLPLSIRPALGNLADWLPSATDKSCLRLSESYRGELVFLEPLSNPSGGRFFVITPEMMESHQINIGTSLSSYYQRLLDQHSSRVEQFLLSCHPYEGLRYLLRHLIETTNSRGSSKIDNTGSTQQQDPIQRSKLDKLFDEIEDIYYYVRTGRFPSHFRSLNSLPSTDRNPFPDRQLILHKACVLTPINSPNVAGTHCDKCSEKNTDLYVEGSAFTSSTQNRSASWNDLHNTENKPPVPPLPMRVYLNVHQDCDGSPVPYRSDRTRTSLPVVNNPSYDQSIDSVIHSLKLSRNIK